LLLRSKKEEGRRSKKVKKVEEGRESKKIKKVKEG
jgi:hypothetical protein